MSNSKHIVILVPDNVSILDVAGPLDVFTKAKEHIRENYPAIKESYTTHVLSFDSLIQVSTSAGLPIITEGGIESINYEIDTILVAGNATLKVIPQSLLDWLKAKTDKVRRMGSICAGAFVLAKAGILNGRRATTHWMV